MLTELLDQLILGKLNELQFIATTPSSGAFDAYTFCSDGSCRGDCVGGCDGTPAGGFNN